MRGINFFRMTHHLLPEGAKYLRISVENFDIYSLQMGDKLFVSNDFSFLPEGVKNCAKIAHPYRMKNLIFVATGGKLFSQMTHNFLSEYVQNP